MERKKLADSDITVSPICVGCWQFNGGEQSADKTWNAQDEQVDHAPCHSCLVEFDHSLGIVYSSVLSKCYVVSLVMTVMFLLQVSRDIVDKALELGINFFDTAEVIQIFTIALKKNEPIKIYVLQAS